MNSVQKLLNGRKIAILRWVAAEIGNHRHEYICVAIEDFIKQWPVYSKAGTELIAYVSEAVGGPDNTLMTWQHRNRTPMEVLNTNVRQDRIAWLNWMIACYKEDSKCKSL